MTLLTRRALVAAAGTLAVATPMRKPLAQGMQDGTRALKLADTPAAPPPLVITLPDGSTLGLPSFAGKGVVLNIWATWCVPCVAEMPSLAGLSRALADDGILVLPVSADRQGEPIVRKFYESHHIDGLPVLLDPRGEMVRLLGLRGIPTTLVIDRHGREMARAEGAVAWDKPKVVALIRRLVG